MIYFTSENILLIGSILIFCSILFSKAGYKYGVPALLLFLLVGMIFGVDGIGVVFNNYRQTQFIGIIALSIILFTGGMETKFQEIKPIILQGLTLSTIGVLLTTIFLGFFLYFFSNAVGFISPLPIIICLLLAAIMSSTDSASVFNILKNSNIRLKHNIRPILELESGSNDPMAYCTIIILLNIAKVFLSPNINNNPIDYISLITNGLITFILQIGLGCVIGLGVGFACVWIIKRIQLHSTPLYAIMLLSTALFTISITEMFKGNGYLAVYLAGVIIGNNAFPSKKEIMKFMDGMTWLMQISMFLTLGLLVNPKEMLNSLPIALITGLFLIFIARPLAVFISLSPYKYLNKKSKLLISWVGLKGAAPIIFATYPIIVHIPEAIKIFNIVFIVTMLSLIFQGMSMSRVAKWLHLSLPIKKAPDTFGIEIPEEAGKLIDCTLTSKDLKTGNTLKEIKLPEGARVVMIYRSGKHIVPDGSIELMAGDKLLMICGDYSEE